MSLVHCLTKAQMVQFLEMVNIQYSREGSFMVLHAAVGDAYWLWNGVSFCTGTGIMS